MFDNLLYPLFQFIYMDMHHKKVIDKLCLRFVLESMKVCQQRCVQNNPFKLIYLVYESKSAISMYSEQDNLYSTCSMDSFGLEFYG